MARSRVLEKRGERKRHREAGPLFSTSDGVRMVFFRRGFTLFSFKDFGKQPVDREALIR